MFRTHSEQLPVWAALCTARADGSDSRYVAQIKHSLLVMVRASEVETESAVCALLKANGWFEPIIQRLKEVSRDFHSDDPVMRECYAGAINKDGGIVIYSDPIEDA